MGEDVFGTDRMYVMDRAKVIVNPALLVKKKRYIVGDDLFELRTGVESYGTGFPLVTYAYTRFGMGCDDNACPHALWYPNPKGDPTAEIRRAYDKVESLDALLGKMLFEVPSHKLYIVVKTTYGDKPHVMLQGVSDTSGRICTATPSELLNRFRTEDGKPCGQLVARKRRQVIK